MSRISSRCLAQLLTLFASALQRGDCTAYVRSSNEFITALALSIVTSIFRPEVASTQRTTGMRAPRVIVWSCS